MKFVKHVVGIWLFVFFQSCMMMGESSRLTDMSDVYSGRQLYEGGRLSVVVEDKTLNEVCFEHLGLASLAEKYPGANVLLVFKPYGQKQQQWRFSFDKLQDYFVDGKMVFPVKRSYAQGMLSLVLFNEQEDVLAAQVLRLRNKSAYHLPRYVRKGESLCLPKDVTPRPFSISYGWPLPFGAHDSMRLALYEAKQHKAITRNRNCWQPAEKGVLKIGETYIPVVASSFPEVKSAAQLVEAICYLNPDSTLLNALSSEQKWVVDSFWLARSSNRNQARKLLRAYYKRVVFANTQFTDWRPGYLTDRGQIYILLGPPDELYLELDKERWTYYPEGTGPGTQFIFSYGELKGMPVGWYLELESYHVPLFERARDRWLDGKILFFQSQD